MVSSPLLDARELVVRYGGYEAVHGISLEVHAGEVVGLIGPDGAGKTSTLRVLGGLQRAGDGGGIYIGGEQAVGALGAGSGSVMVNANLIQGNLIGLGEDGPTHQPVEHLASLRAIPNLTVIRPADATETAEAWRRARAWAAEDQHRIVVVTGSLYLIGNVRERWYPTQEVFFQPADRARADDSANSDRAETEG